MSHLRISKLSKTFGSSVAVSDFDLEVAEGEFVSLLGPSGCGKTTTLRCVAGLEQPTSGSICFGEHDVTALPSERRNIGMVFQNYALFPHMTVAENIGFGLQMRRVSKQQLSDRVRSVVEMVQLNGFEARFPRQLSGGQQQRVALARALVIEPAILLLDEPLANLDAKLREEMRSFIRSLQQKVRITTLYVTHDQAESMTMSDRVVVIFNGLIHQIGSPRDIYERPRTLEVARFIGQANLLDGSIAERRGERVEIRTALGDVTFEGGEVPHAEAVKVLLRPEAMSVGKSGSGIKAHIVSEHFLGNMVDYRIALADGMHVSVHVMGGQQFGVGTEVTITVDPRRVWVVPCP
jgi:putative spermidine/putrescine transport system ATP-binding protein